MVSSVFGPLLVPARITWRRNEAPVLADRATDEVFGAVPGGCDPRFARDASYAWREGWCVMQGGRWRSLLLPNRSVLSEFASFSPQELHLGLTT